ncbi:Mediator of RNA polymerase II transcription subunit 21 [Grifola frondosa]|uniref:Mediator of RNA polymerase II transcription subunit 21 n=1 Tax=Grifola frondosa TaxID=5627 RepID=A0A1C7MRJ0_GRIFR|nr:Mediator of RNA polymerase II transcription subunit 21 [Grifola frondosa]
MLQELSHMDRITQLQDEIQQVLNLSRLDIHELNYVPQLLTIMSSSIAYLTSRSNFMQVSPEVPITKQRNTEKYDAPDVFEANKKELMTDLMVKAKQVEYLIQSLPEPEAEEVQAKRLQTLEEEMIQANEDYARAVYRAKNLHAQISTVLRSMLDESDSFEDEPG